MGLIKVQDVRNDARLLAETLGIDEDNIQKIATGGRMPEGVFNIILASEADVVKIRRVIGELAELTEVETDMDGTGDGMSGIEGCGVRPVELEGNDRLNDGRPRSGAGVFTAWTEQGRQ